MGIERVPEGINRPSTPALSETSAAQQARQLRSGPGSSGTRAVEPTADRVEISEESRVLAHALQEAQDAPDVRSDKVAEIQARLEQGAYSVPAEALARKLLGELSND